MSKYRKLSLVFLVIVVVCAIAAYSLILGFQEDLFFKKWSLSYFLFTPSIIENVPQPDKIGEAEYYHSAGDTPKPMAEGISFESNASKNEILSQFDEYLSHHGYVRDSADADFFEYQYSKDSNKFYLTIEAIEGWKNGVVARECYFL